MKRLYALAMEQLEHRTLMSVSPTTATVVNRPSVRSIDGTDNNLVQTDWGSAGVDLLRFASAAYGNGVSTPAGANRPSGRAVSDALSDQGDVETVNAQSLSAMAYAWGQFIDHDLDLTPNGTSEVFNVAVPTGDPSFDPNGTGTQVIPFVRSIFDSSTGANSPRQQVNVVTAWLDGSMVYGSDDATASALRTFSGGKLKTSAGDLLPLNNAATFPTGTLSMANDAHRVPNSQLFAAGDVRANENVELTSLQTLFVREHNCWAGRIAAGNRLLTDEQIYQQARAIVIAEIQSITYNQWLPTLLGPNALSRYTGYDSTVNPGIANEFSTAAFRFGHSMLGDDVEFLDDNGDDVREGVALSDAFFNPDLIQEVGVDPLLKYLSSDPAMEIDTRVVDSVRNFLFGPPGSGGLDLASLNIQRGRDHGLADYNSVRVAYGLPRVTSFAQITSDVEVQAKLAQVYGSVDNIDLWVGGLAENHVRGSSVGPTMQAIIADQFERLRDGDRFWYQRTFSGTMLSTIQHTTLSDIIQRNTDLTNLQDNVFAFKASVSGQVYADANGDGRLNRLENTLGGQTVQLLSVETGEVVATTKSDSRGRYRFDVASGVRTGDYQVQVVLPRGSTQTTSLSRPISITAGDDNATGIDLAVVPKRPTRPTGPTRLRR